MNTPILLRADAFEQDARAAGLSKKEMEAARRLQRQLAGIQQHEFPVTMNLRGKSVRIEIPGSTAAPRLLKQVCDLRA